MTENEALNALKLEGGLQIDGKAKRVAQFFEGLSVAEEALTEIQQYQAIGTVEELQALKEKETPKKPIPNKPLKRGEYIGWHCPMCNKERWSGFFYPPLRFNARCPICGQVIDWNFREYER